MNTDILFQNHKIILWIYFLEISKFPLQVDLQIAAFNHYSFEQTITIQSSPPPFFTNSSSLIELHQQQWTNESMNSLPKQTRIILFNPYPPLHSLILFFT